MLGRNLSNLSILIPSILFYHGFYFIYFVSGFALHAAGRALQFALAGRIECGSRNEASCVGLAQGEGEQKTPIERARAEWD